MRRPSGLLEVSSYVAVELGLNRDCLLHDPVPYPSCSAVTGQGYKPPFWRWSTLAAIGTGIAWFCRNFCSQTVCLALLASVTLQQPLWVVCLFMKEDLRLSVLWCHNCAGPEVSVGHVRISAEFMLLSWVLFMPVDYLPWHNRVVPKVSYPLCYWGCLTSSILKTVPCSLNTANTPKPWYPLQVISLDAFNCIPCKVKQNNLDSSLRCLTTELCIFYFMSL